MNYSTSHGALYGGAPPQGISTDPLIINVCLTGNVFTREISPHLSVSVEEIVEDAAAVLEAGASMLVIRGTV